jgi:hypothetical protein
MPSAGNWVTWSFALAVMRPSLAAPSAAHARATLCGLHGDGAAREPPGPRFGVATQYTHFGTLQNGGEEVPNPFEQRLDSVIAQVVRAGSSCRGWACS